MITVHLTGGRYRGILAAYGKGSDIIHVPFESEPNLKLGDEVEVVVHEPGRDELRQVGIVVDIARPPDPDSLHDLRAIRKGKAAAEAEFKERSGVDPKTLPVDEGYEEIFRLQWLVQLKHKD